MQKAQPGVPEVASPEATFQTPKKGSSSYTSFKSKTFRFSSPFGTRETFPPTSGTVPDSTNNLCHPSRAFEQAFNHLQPTRLLLTNLKPEPDRDKQTTSFPSSPSVSSPSRIRSSLTLTI
ncbi:hypothetical protein CROQUDRAFT_104418 [Cronartium quercuum f. sp. fusiforme G11]|uniref:Uncharacterized protein n=1 Tax=Cronartium quercuum f. sp. fusiforme G11 TaxID=708437 RepID=A0A9P6NU88_9BASI|nr:hypothetical protein CROQUDRAFT_104418 [Cronartium quercuum f. sp. fusiforme G11]